MFQNLLADHVNEFAPVFTDIALATNGVRYFRNSFAVGNLESNQVGVSNGTPGAGVWVGIGCLVSDPDFRGPMVFSYDAVLIGNLAPQAVLPLLLDRQGLAASPAGTSYAFASTTDLAFSVPQCDYESGASWRLGARGRVLVNTAISSSTPNIAVREFGVSLSVQLPATAVQLSYAVSARLYAVDERFFQPSK